MEENREELLIRFQILRSQLEQMKKQESTLDEHESELAATETAIMEFGQVKNGSSTIMQVAGGIFMKGKVEDTNTFLVNVGANIVVEKSREDLLAHIKKQKSDLEEIKTGLERGQATILAEARDLQKQLQKKH